VIVPKVIRGTLDGNGNLSVSLPATDDPDLDVIGWTYTVTEHVADAGRPPFQIEVPYSATSIDLSTVAPAVSLPVAVQTALTRYDIGVTVASEAEAAKSADLAAPTGAGLVGVQVGTASRTVAAKLGEVVSVKDFGAVGDGVTDDTAAFNAMTAYLRARMVDTPDYDYAPVALVIPPAAYAVSSWDLTGLLIQNVHVIAHGAVLVANTAGKHVVDALDSRYIKFHGLMVYSASGVVAKSGLQVGPRGGGTCGNFLLSDITIAGYFASAPYMNLGAETTQLRNARFIQRSTDPNAFAQICDGLSTYLPTSDYVTVTRSAGQVLSFTANSYNACQLRNEGGGSASYLGGSVGWEFDKGCYHLSYNDSAFVVYGTLANRSAKLALRGSFEAKQTDTPTVGNTGLKYIVTFANDGTNTAIDGFALETSNMQAQTAVLRVTGGGTCRVSDADIRVHAIEQPAAVLFGSGSLAVDGLVMTQTASKANFGALSSFNGIADVDAYTSLASLPTAGGYTVYSRSDNTVYHGGAQEFPSAITSFTPVATFATPGDLSVSYTTQTGKYFKIGKLVFVQLSLTFTPTYTTASGEFRISGMPGSAASGALDNGLELVNGSTGFTYPASCTWASARLPQNSSFIRLYGHGSGVASTVLQAAQVPSGTAKTITISGCYLAA
jgi:hypothetical protein